MTYPVPPGPGGAPSGGGQGPAPQYGAPHEGSGGQGYGAPGAPAYDAGYPGTGAPGDPGQSGYGAFGGAPGSTPPPTPPGRRWGIWAGVGCGCLLVLAAIIALIVVIFVNSGGDGDEPTARGTTATSPTETTTSDAPSTTTEPVTTTTSAGPAPVTPEDQAAASQTMVDLSKALVHGDVDGICQKVLNPISRQPFKPTEMDLCRTQMQRYAGGGTEEQKTAIDALTADQVTTTVNDDGTISAATPYSTADFTLRRADDGLWYVDLSGG